MKNTRTTFSRRTLLALAAATVALPFVAPVDAFAGTVEEAKAKGKVVIGIQGDNSPWGFVNSSGVQDGLDADIGKAFAEYLGVKVEFVPLAVANRIQALISGQVEVVGGNQFYGDRLNAAAKDKYEPKFDLTTLYNGAGTRPGEKDWNETINTFLDKIKSDGQLAKIYDKWMKREVPSFPDSLPDIPFTVK